jgi:Ca-activated chloride channel family protein
VRRTLAVIALALVSLAAAAFAALRPRSPGVAPAPEPAFARAGALRLSAALDRAWVSESHGGEAYLEVNIAADGKPEEGARIPVNAVLVIDRSGSMSGQKLARAKDAARELLARLNGDDRFALIDFGSSARLLVPSMAASGSAKESALQLVNGLQAQGGTNISAALDLAGPELARGRAPGRVDKVFLASDGQANEGIATRIGLMEVSRRAFGEAAVSTFGVGADYDEDLMTSLATQSGGLTHFIRTADEIVPAFRAELQRATKAVARNVRLVVQPAPGARLEKVIGYESDGGHVRLPDFAAGERRRVLVKLQLPPGRGKAELAKVELTFGGENGAGFAATAAASATYTADDRLASRRVSAAAYQGARAEMAELATEAANFANLGRVFEAKKRVGRMVELQRFAEAASDKREDRAAIAKEMDAYQRTLKDIQPASAGTPSAAPAKAMKQQAFDNLRGSY